jgi:hypothetical protein
MKETDMTKKQVMFTFPPELIKEPIIHSLGQRFKVVTNIRRADINGDKGWVVLELEGETRLDAKDISGSRCHHTNSSRGSKGHAALFH